MEFISPINVLWEAELCKWMYEDIPLGFCLKRNGDKNLNLQHLLVSLSSANSTNSFNSINSINSINSTNSTNSFNSTNSAKRVESHQHRRVEKLPS